jgi:pseudaminic acid cytidylyltransferase
MTRLAIIPARSGSKRIKNKNFKYFFGKPIINYSIDLAIESKLFDTIHVSTDSEEYLKKISNKKIDTSFKRPKYLSLDSTPLLDVIKYTINKYDKLNIKFTEIFLISSCNPLIKIADLNKGYRLFKKYKMKYPIMPIIKFPIPINWALTLSNESIKEISKNNFNQKSQNFKNYYYDSSSFYIFSRDILKFNSVDEYINSFKSFEVSQFNSIDIDNMDDWKLAEAIYNFNKKNEK